jgi:hypothetical protein
MATEINHALRDHELTTRDWPWAELASTLHTWTERFNVEFKLDVSIPAIQVEELPFRTLGTYRSGRNGFALKDEITINARRVQRPLSRILTTLLHELLHEWQAKHGQPGKRNYHNEEFRAKARTLGLVVDRRGHTHVVPGPFAEILQRHGVDVAPTVPAPNQLPAAAGPGSKLKKWSCGCTNVRAAVELEAVCARCGEWFVPV